jgi:CheY-like chemotaxis protein
MTTVSKKILVVDDEEAKTKVMKMGLAKLGYNPKFDENGKEALEILAQGNVSTYFNGFKITRYGRH